MQMREGAIAELTQLLQSHGYTVDRVEDSLLEARKKRLLQIVVGDAFTDEEIEQSLQKLREVREEGAYVVIALPSSESSGISYDFKHLFACYEDLFGAEDINLWGIEMDSRRIYMPMGSMPNFDYKLMTKLMESKSMNLMAQKVKERAFRQQVLEKR
ncbi:MAG: DUF4350 domain-containing protein [Candidatus Tectomicrobia bacterium]|uniref:DUF4350 domain-containing protein n=1 Tax=Tectimicrobiota bacterium TaxID=2528274 RepID=A0A932CM00_UNCTE|nr:DUF4350 domain-containing protein [Candidatus Tectomicrobia bacterium]